MPLYDYKCMNCGVKRIDVYLKAANVTDHMKFDCPTCGKVSLHELQIPTPAAHDWGNCGQGRYYEHVSKKGEYFTSKKQMKDYLKKHGLREQLAYD